MKRPHLVIISDSIRRDLHAPLAYFEKVRVTHLWRQANYADMTKTDWQAAANHQFDSALALWQLLKNLKPDLIQGVEPLAGRRAMLLSSVVWLYSRASGTPYLFPAMENRPILEKHGPFWGKLINWWTGIYGRGAIKVIYVNQGARRNLIEAGVEESKLVHKLWGNWGINVGEFSPQHTNYKLKRITNSKSIRNRRLLVIGRSDKSVILFVGKISTAKGVPWLIEAMELVVKEFPKAQLWLAGQIDKNHESRIMNYGFIKHLGVVKNNQIAALYRQATLVAAPSVTTKTWAEQVGNVIWQAMSCAVPVVTTRSGAIPEFVENGQGVILVPEKDSKALAAAISGLLGNDKIRGRMSRLGRKWILNHYDARRNIAALERWLLGLMAIKR